MASLNHSPVYRAAKGLWLLMQSLLLPMMALFLAREWPQSARSVFLEVLLGLVGSFFLILWLMAHAVLSMGRFPLTTRGALRLTLSQVSAFLISWVLFGFPLFAAYATFLTTLASLIICGFLLARGAVAAGLTDRRTAFFASLVLLAGSAGTAWLAVPLWREVARLEWWASGLSVTTLVVNVWMTVRSLWSVTILGAKADPDSDAYSAEWQHWAAPTIIALILSATAAIVFGGIARSASGR